MVRVLRNGRGAIDQHMRTPSITVCKYCCQSDKCSLLLLVVLFVLTAWLAYACTIDDDCNMRNLCLATWKFARMCLLPPFEGRGGDMFAPGFLVRLSKNNHLPRIRGGPEESCLFCMIPSSVALVT